MKKIFYPLLGMFLVGAVQTLSLNATEDTYLTLKDSSKNPVYHYNLADPNLPNIIAQEGHTLQNVETDQAHKQATLSFEDGTRYTLMGDHVKNIDCFRTCSMNFWNQMQPDERQKGNYVRGYELTFGFYKRDNKPNAFGSQGWLLKVRFTNDKVYNLFAARLIPALEEDKLFSLLKPIVDQNGKNGEEPMTVNAYGHNKYNANNPDNIFNDDTSNGGERAMQGGCSANHIYALPEPTENKLIRLFVDKFTVMEDGTIPFAEEASDLRHIVKY